MTRKKKHMTNEVGDCAVWCPACGPACEHGRNSYECLECNSTLKVYHVEATIRYSEPVVAESKEAALEVARRHLDEMDPLDSEFAATELTDSRFDDVHPWAKSSSVPEGWLTVGQIRKRLEAERPAEDHPGQEGLFGGGGRG